MKILFIIDSLGSGGAQRQMVTLAKLFTGKGFIINLLVYHEENFFKDEIDQSNIPVFLIRSKNNLGRILRVRRFIRGGHYDVVISFLDVPNFLNCISAIGKKTWKVITSERSAKQVTFNTTRRRILNWFQRYSDAIVCNSYNAKTIWEHFYPQYGAKLSVIYNPVFSLPHGLSYTPQKNGKTNIVVAASYQYLKNPLGLIEALVLMNHADRDKIEITWYGNKNVSPDGNKPYREALEKIKKHGLEKVITLNDPTNEIMNKMNEADIVALFSSVEGLPNAICEGMMIGKPIIMTRVSDYKILVDESNGFLCNWDDPNSIKDALVKACNLSVEELSQMGKHSRIKADNLFNPKEILDKWIKLIN